MANKKLLRLMQAHTLGFTHGRELGIEHNPYDPEDYPEETWAYRQGYDAGVAEYCREAHPEDIETLS